MNTNHNPVPFDLTIQNYRCFQEPVTLSMGANLTAIIGINNSGKSSILRFFYEFRDVFVKLESAIRGNGLNNIFNRQTNQIFNLQKTIGDYEEMFCDRNNEDIEFTITWSDRSYDTKEPKEMKISITVGRSNPTWHPKLRIGGVLHSEGVFGGISLRGEIIDWGNQISTKQSDLVSIFDSLVKTQYIGSYRNILDANPSYGLGEKNYYDLEIGSAFVERWSRLKSGSKRSDNVLAAKVTEDIKRILNYDYLEINPTHANDTLQIIIDGRSYRLPELGSGIAQFIIVFVNAALVNPAYILIDEPELNLHPSLQLDFLSSLASYASEGVLYATHNAGLAIGYADRIYSVRRTPTTSKVSLYEDTPRLSEFLGELGFAAYRDLGFDKILLVEGPSEIKVIGQWLRLYKLSHKVVLIHLGGGSSIHDHSDAELQEIMRISSNVYVLIDSERSKAGAPLDPPREGFVKTCEKAGICCFVTERRATENYFTDRAVKMALGDSFNGLQPFELLNDVSNRWKKTQNWRIAQKMTKDEIEATDLRELFAQLVA